MSQDVVISESLPGVILLTTYTGRTTSCRTDLRHGLSRHPRTDPPTNTGCLYVSDMETFICQKYGSRDQTESEMIKALSSSQLSSSSNLFKHVQLMCKVHTCWTIQQCCSTAALGLVRLKVGLYLWLWGWVLCYDKKRNPGRLTEDSSHPISARNKTSRYFHSLSLLIHESMFKLTAFVVRLKLDDV